MHINSDNNSNVLVRHIIRAILLITLASTASSKENCRDQSSASESCEQVETKSVQGNSQENENSSMINLYYSGSIIHNASTANEVISSLEMATITNAESIQPPKDEIIDHPPLDPGEDGLYNEIGKAFRQFDPLGRKKIQRCLRYGSYNGKVDGLWGNQTFDAIIDFKKPADFEQVEAEEGIFSKIKNVFSSEKACYELINDIFRL